MMTKLQLKDDELVPQVRWLIIPDASGDAQACRLLIYRAASLLRKTS